MSPDPGDRPETTGPEHPGPIGGEMNTDYLMAMGSIDDRMLILVDIEKLMASRDMGLMDSGTLQ